MMKVSTRWLTAGLACILIFTVLAAIKFFQIQAAIAFGNSFPEPSESVEAVIATAGTFSRTYSTIGEIVSPQSIELRNELEGQIAQVNVSSGDKVKKGDILVQMDVSEESARLQAARARAELARLELDRAERLVKQRSVSEESRDQAQASYDIASADVKAIQATIAKKTLRAPFDATVGLHNLDAGEYLQSNSSVVTLVGLSPVTWVDFNVPPGRGEVAIGTEIAIELPGENGETLPAKIMAGNAVASASSRNLKLRARIDQPVGLPPNTVVKVIVPMGESEHIQLPRIALLFDNRGSYVFVLEENPQGEGYRAKYRAVEVADKNEEVVSLTSGLEAGELVATDGAFKLYPEILTRVRERHAEVGDSGE